MNHRSSLAQQEIILRKPDDFHIHLRDEDFLNLTVNHAAERFSRVGVMPNLVPPVTTTAAAMLYRQRILQSLHHGQSFNPLMILFLRKNTALADIEFAAQSEHFLGVKYYPTGVTTNSLSAIQDISDAHEVLECMQEHQLPLLVHGETATQGIDIFDREKIFLTEQLAPVLERFPKLPVVLEHITTADAVDFVKAHHGRVGATITAHHLIFNRNDMLADGLRPHLYCKPILKRRAHQEALRAAATSGAPAFFLGTDSAPHALQDKESACGCAGCYTSHAAIELYAQVFDEEGALDQLEQFSSINGAQFYGLEPNQQTITLLRQEWQPDAFFAVGDRKVVPLQTQSPVQWTLKR